MGSEAAATGALASAARAGAAWPGAAVGGAGPAPPPRGRDPAAPAALASAARAGATWPGTTVVAAVRVGAKGRWVMPQVTTASSNTEAASILRSRRVALGRRRWT